MNDNKPQYYLEIIYDRFIGRFSYMYKYMIRRFESSSMYNEQMTNSKYNLKMWLNMKFGDIKLRKRFNDNEGYTFEIIY